MTKIAKLYINWNNGIVINHTQYKEKLQNKYQEYSNDEKYFEEWLNDNFTQYEVFKMGQKEILAEWQKAVTHWAEEDLEEIYQPYIIDNIEDFIVEEE